MAAKFTVSKKKNGEINVSCIYFWGLYVLLLDLGEGKSTISYLQMMICI